MQTTTPTVFVEPMTIVGDPDASSRRVMHVRVRFDEPPVGFSPLMPWKDVVGLGDEDFKRYEEHRRLVRIVAAEPYRELVAERWQELLYPLLGGVV